jgi:hypothetical protein
MISAPIVVVTGANRGIGFEISRQLASRGAEVVLTARKAGAGKAAVEKLAARDLTVQFQPLDVTSRKSRAAIYDIPISLPAPYPAHANLVASVGMRQGWGVPFVRAAYRRWLQLGQETGSEPKSESLRDVGVEPRPALALAKTAEAKAALMEETGLARNLGIFGSPTFVVGRELFWGDDRLEDAISWYRYGSVRSLTLLDFPEPDSLGG